MQFVIVPGIDNSDQQHWQSIWESEWALLLGVLQLRRGPHLTSTIGWVRLSGPCAWRQPLMWCWLLTAVDVGLLRAGWPTEGSDALGLFLVAPPDQHGDLFRAALPSFTAVVPQPLELPGFCG